jgi:hypothetical protein
MECEQVVLTLIEEASVKLVAAEIIAFLYGGSEAGGVDLPGTK